MSEPLPSRIDAEDWPELSYAHGLTDGLPTFPPERRRVDALVAASGRDGREVVGRIPPAGRVATVESIAANAVMAGCLPEPLPVVLAALEAMLEPRFNLAGLVVTTHPAWPLVVVGGRIVDDLAMASGESLFSGGGARANVAVGRAVKLVVWNIGGAHPRLTGICLPWGKFLRPDRASRGVHHRCGRSVWVRVRASGRAAP